LIKPDSKGIKQQPTKHMTVLPTPTIPGYTQKYLNITPPAGLVVLDKTKRILPPAAADGSGLPPDTITPYSGIYDSNGHLPTIPGPGTTFIAYA
jgi:hypothetical protein